MKAKVSRLFYRGKKIEKDKSISTCEGILMIVGLCGSCIALFFEKGGKHVFPEIHDVTIQNMSEFGFIIKGIETINFRKYYQEWKIESLTIFPANERV